jgi:cytochrome P450
MARVSKSAVPGPRRWSPFGSLPQLQRDPLGTFLRAREDYGDAVKFRAGMWFAYLLSHPDAIKHVLQDNAPNYRKGFTYDSLKPLIGLGLLTNEGELWLRQRRLAQPAFHHQRLGGLADVMTAPVEHMLARWRDTAAPGPIDVADEMTRLTMQVITRALLGSSLGADATRVNQAVTVGQEHVNWRITHLISLPERYPTPRNLRFKRALRVLDAAVYSLIEQRRMVEDEAIVSRDESGTSTDLLSLLMEASDEETGQGMTDRQLRDEVMTIFLAGHETMANALAWTWHLLALHPEVEEQLHAEVDHVLNGKVPLIADLPHLRYTRMVLDEALRLRPPVWAMVRFPLADDTVGGFRLPAYTSVVLSPYVTHRHPEFWEEPERFDPERFRPELVSKRPRFSYFPFGGGSHLCIGNEFAIMGCVLVLATIAREFRLLSVPGHRVELEPLITLRPLGGLPMLFEPRDKGRPANRN